MADYARSFISKIVSTKDVLTAITAGVRGAWFDDPEHAAAYEWINEYFVKYGESPTSKAFRRQFPTYRLLVVEEPYAYYVEHFQLQRQRAILVDALVGAEQAIKSEDYRAAQGVLSDGLFRIGTEATTLVDEDAVGEGKIADRLAAYKDKRDNQGKLVGITTGFPTLDLASGGWQPQQFIIFGGQAKQAKSFMLLKSAMSAQDQGKKVLFMSFEMSVQEQLTRYDAITAGVNANHLLQGKVTDEDLRLVRKRGALRKNLPPFIVSTDISASTTVSGLAAKIEQHRPDVVFVDGLYLMENEVGAEPHSAQAYTSISRSLKRLAQRTELPIIGTTQALSAKVGKDGAITLHSLGYSSAWGQDTDMVLGVEKIEGASLLRLRVVAGRNVSPHVITVLCDFDTSVFEEVDATEEDDS